MHDAVAMSEVEGGGNANSDLCRFGERYFLVAIQPVANSLAFDQGNHVVDDAIMLAGVVNGNDVRVTEAGSSGYLVEETRGANRCGYFPIEHFDGDPAVM